MYKLFTAMATCLSTVKGEVICEFVETYCCESGDMVYKKPDSGLCALSEPAIKYWFVK